MLVVRKHDRRAVLGWLVWAGWRKSHVVFVWVEIMGWTKTRS